jgi:hypothetical protein
MPKTKNFYFQNRYFISGVRFSTLLERPENMGKTASSITQEYGIDSNISWRFKKLDKDKNEKGNLQIDLSQVNINTTTEPVWMNVDDKIIHIAKQMIDEGLSDEEISSKIYINLMKEGFKMENNKLVENSDKNMVYDVILDNGNYNIKAKCGEHKITMTSKICKQSLPDLPNLEWVKYGGKKIYIGTENAEYIGEYDKVKKFKDVKCQILYAVDKVVDSDQDIYDVNLGYLLPITQTSRAGSIIDSLQGQEFEFETQNGSRIITIKSVNIMPEGYSSTRLFIEDENMINYLDGDLLITDLGSRTINAVSLSDGDIINADTLECGSFDLYGSIQNDLKNNKGKDKSIEKIAYLYEKDKLIVDDSILIDYLNKIKEALQGYNKDLEDYDNIVFTGGVANLLSNNKLSNGITLLDKLIEILGVHKDIVHVLDNPTESNIDGAMLLLQEMSKVA